MVLILGNIVLVCVCVCAGKHVCQVSSQCNGDSFCLVSDELSRQCRCDARRIRKMKGPESDDLFDCTCEWLRKIFRGWVVLEVYTSIKIHLFFYLLFVCLFSSINLICFT